MLNERATRFIEGRMKSARATMEEFTPRCPVGMLKGVLEEVTEEQRFLRLRGAYADPARAVFARVLSPVAPVAT